MTNCSHSFLVERSETASVMVEVAVSVGIFLLLAIGGIELLVTMYTYGALQYSAAKTARLISLGDNSNTPEFIERFVVETGRSFNLDLDLDNICICSQGRAGFPDSCPCGTIELGRSTEMVSVRLQKSLRHSTVFPLSVSGSLIVRNE